MVKEEKLLENENIDFNNEVSYIKENLINWYPFSTNSDILEITTDDEIKLTEYLKSKSYNVIRLIAEKEMLSRSDIGKFNYVIIHNIDVINKSEISLEQILEFAKEHQKENGTILISIKNSLGIENLNCSSPNQAQSNEEKNMYLKNDVLNLINQIFENYHYKFYYPLPNEDYPNVFFTDKHLPSQEGILRDMTLYKPHTVVKDDEREIFRKLLKEDQNLFGTFANTFLVEISLEPIKTDIEYVSFGNSRKPEYRLKTVMTDTKVYKEPISKKAEGHISEIKENIEILEKSNIYMLDKYENGRIYSKLIKQEISFDKFLINEANKNGMDSIIDWIKKFKDELDIKLEKSENNNLTVFEKYGLKCNSDLKNKMHFIKHGIFDLIFQNCFVIDNKFYFYDQEWREENIPLEFIIYRAIYYLGNSNNLIDTDMLYKSLNLTNFIEIFNKLEFILQEKIKDDEIWDIHREGYMTVNATYATMVHFRNLHAELKKDYDKLEEEKEKSEKELDNKIIEKEKLIDDLQKKIKAMENSRSWRITKPLRYFNGKFNNKAGR
mgnify:FL=1